MDPRLKNPFDGFWEFSTEKSSIFPAEKLSKALIPNRPKSLLQDFSTTGFAETASFNIIAGEKIEATILNS